MPVPPLTRCRPCRATASGSARPRTRAGRSPPPRARRCWPASPTSRARPARRPTGRRPRVTVSDEFASMVLSTPPLAIEIVPAPVIGPPLRPAPVPTLVTVPPAELSVDGFQLLDAESYLSTCWSVGAVADTALPWIAPTVVALCVPVTSPDERAGEARRAAGDAARDRRREGLRPADDLVAAEVDVAEREARQIRQASERGDAPTCRRRSSAGTGRPPSERW